MSNDKRIVAVFTGNRAEYGLQFPILKAIERHPDLEYRLVVSGAHLDKNFGQSLKEIENDGFTVHEQVAIDLEEDSLYATAKAIGTGVVSVGKALARLKPDIFVVYADRFEGFAAVIAGTQMNIPTAHIEGGDITEGGALDDSVRHAMTKLAHLHFTTNEEARKRILHMGEEEWRVHNVGFPAIDLINEGNFATPAELEKKYNIDLKQPVVIFTQHSVTTQFESARDQLAPSLEAMEQLANEGIQIVLTYPNNDAGGLAIIDVLEKFNKRKIKNTQLHKSLGRYNYHGFLNLCGDKQTGGACVGNSSSGLKETPAFACPSVIIGTRQNGRLAAKNLIHTDYDREEIVSAVHRCIQNQDFLKLVRTCENPYGVGDAGDKIANVLSSVELGRNIITKKMTLKSL